MHQMRTFTPSSRIGVPDSKSARLLKVAAPTTTARLRAVNTGRPPRTVSIIDLSGQPFLPSLAVGRLAAAIRATGDEARVFIPDADASGVSWSRRETARERFVQRCETLGSPLAPALRLAALCRGLIDPRHDRLSVARSVHEAEREASRTDRTVLATDRPQCARVATALAALRERGLQAETVSTVLERDYLSTRGVVADFSDYAVARIRVLPIVAADAHVGKRSAEFVLHEIREYQRRYGGPDLAFQDPALNDDPIRLAALVEGLQRNAPGVQWIASVAPGLGVDGLSRRDLRLMAAAGLRRLTIGLDSVATAAEPAARLERVAQFLREASDAGISTCVRVLDEAQEVPPAPGRPSASPASVSFIESIARCLSECRDAIQRVRIGEARPAPESRVAVRGLLRVVSAINARAALRGALAFEHID